MTRQVPQKHSSAYLAGQLIYQQGSLLVPDLFRRVSYGTVPSRRNARLQYDIDTGWLRRLADGRIALTDLALAHYEGAPAPKAAAFVGVPAAPRQINVMDRGSWKSHLNPRGTRPGTEWAHRSNVTFYTKA